MLKLMFGLLRTTLFVFIILLLGQIPLKHKAIAAHLTDAVLSLWRSEGKKWVEPLEEITGKEQASLRRFLEKERR